MKYLASLIMVLWVATSVIAQVGGCGPAPRGPNPIPMANQAQANQVQGDIYARQQAAMQAQHTYQSGMMQAQQSFQMQQLQNRTNPQGMQAAAQQYQQRVQQLQRQFQSDMQAAQRR